eukprot:20950_1
MIDSLISTFDTPFTVLKANSVECKLNDKCSCIERMMATLKLYDTCNINKPYDQNKLIKFCNDIYSTILDDYIHIITIHSNDSKLQQISESIRCDACNCAMVSRHKRDRTQDTIHQNQSTDQHFLFYCDILDSAHFFLYHLYDFG